jgi:hypothetical protein
VGRETETEREIACEETILIKTYERHGRWEKRSRGYSLKMGGDQATIEETLQR